MSDRDGPSDEELVAAHLDGDRGAFAALVDRHERRVYAVCLRYFGNAADAEDALQDTFLTVLNRASTYRGTAAFSTWLYRVAMNACHDVSRRRSRRPQRSDADVSTYTGIAEASDALAARELGMELEGALAQLDETTRAAILLHDVQGLPYADVADRLGIPVGTVKSRIHRGHARLADAVPHLGPRGAGAAHVPEGTLGPSTTSNQQTTNPDTR